MLTKEVLAHKATIQSLQNKLPSDTSFPEYVEKVAGPRNSTGKEDSDAQEDTSKENSSVSNPTDSSLTWTQMPLILLIPPNMRKNNTILKNLRFTQKQTLTQRYRPT